MKNIGFDGTLIPNKAAFDISMGTTVLRNVAIPFREILLETGPHLWEKCQAMNEPWSQLNQSPSSGIIKFRAYHVEPFRIEYIC